jgi:enamine deaminase RidA (YjgF/YER057c/UK114 family)
MSVLTAERRCIKLPPCRPSESLAGRCKPTPGRPRPPVFHNDNDFETPFFFAIFHIIKNLQRPCSHFHNPKPATMSGYDNMEIIQGVPDMVAVPHILSPAVRLGDTLYLSGQTPIDGSGKVVDGDIEELTEYVPSPLGNSDALERPNLSTTGRQVAGPSEMLDGAGHGV